MFNGQNGFKYEMWRRRTKVFLQMDFIWEGLPNPVREKVGKCSSAKEIWDKLHEIYSSPIVDLENAKEDAYIEQEEICSSCQTDLEEEEYEEE
jgi:hypothetical protein